METNFPDKELIGKWSIAVAASLDDVWGILNDSSNMVLWGKSIVKHTTAGKEYLGAIRHCELQLGGKLIMKPKMARNNTTFLVDLKKLVEQP